MAPRIEHPGCFFGMLYDIILSNIMNPRRNRLHEQLQDDNSIRRNPLQGLAGAELNRYDNRGPHRSRAFCNGGISRGTDRLRPNRCRRPCPRSGSQLSSGHALRYIRDVIICESIPPGRYCGSFNRERG